MVRTLRGIAATVGWVALFVVGALVLARIFTQRAPVGPHDPSPEVLADFRQLLGRDVIAPVYEPRFLDAKRAPISPDELVIGLEIDGRARAYPVGFLNFREMVNDRIGPVPFLVTW